MLLLLENRGYIHDFNVNGVNWYRIMADLNGFEDWLNEEIRESKRITRREWIIGIVCAVIGAAIGLIPFVVSLFTN